MIEFAGKLIPDALEELVVPEHTALVLVDLQNDYFPGGKMELEGSPEAGGQAKKVLTYFREKNWPLIHIQHLSARPGATRQRPRPAARQGPADRHPSRHRRRCGARPLPPLRLLQFRTLVSGFRILLYPFPLPLRVLVSWW